MNKLSVFVTTLNNGETLRQCLQSVCFADEIVLLDSFSDDQTLAIARGFGCRIEQQAFAGYGPQKQAALDLTRHRWVLLLDADEALSRGAQEQIRELLAGAPQAAGYSLPRIEQMFWRMQSPASRLNYFLRLFDKTRGHISDMPVHAAPVVEGPVKKLEAPFYHYGENDIHTKVGKINDYSTGLVADKVANKQAGPRWRMILYPPFFFFRSYVFKRQFVNGWAGFVSAVCGSFYVFLKYAKLYEHRQFKRTGQPQRAPGSGVDPGREDRMS
jgi:glycosyltransferase involved in cell wall biosynthesis